MNNATIENTIKLKELIVELVNDVGAIKQIDLVCKIMEKVLPLGDSRISILNINVNDIIEECCIEGLIKSITYILPNSSYRERTILFPKDTIINIKNEVE